MNQPPAVFRVGISGHRPNRLQRSEPTLLHHRIVRVLTTIRDAASTPELRLLSSLAEGTDCLVAHAALALGYTLQVPLPLPRKEYEADFVTPASKAEFQALLAHATAISEPESAPSERALGYRAAGETILAECDLLLVLWDGAPAAGIGGTPELIERARETNRLTLRIDAVAPHSLSFLTGPTETHDPFTALEQCCQALEPRN